MKIYRNIKIKAISKYEYIKHYVYNIKISAVKWLNAINHI